MSDDDKPHSLHDFVEAFMRRYFSWVHREWIDGGYLTVIYTKHGKRYQTLPIMMIYREPDGVEHLMLCGSICDVDLTAPDSIDYLRKHVRDAIKHVKPSP
jgi:hypothetical protein